MSASKSSRLHMSDVLDPLMEKPYLGKIKTIGLTSGGIVIQGPARLRKGNFGAARSPTGSTGDIWECVRCRYAFNPTVIVE